VKLPAITSPHDQRVTFVELFFDLVFVFSVTQVVRLLHHHLDWTGALQSVLVFWLVWWGWTQFTWALNAADTTHPSVELGMLLATAIAFFMAVALPHAFHERALWFAVPYVLLRGIGLLLYAWAASADPGQHAAVRLFSALSLGGLIAVIAGAFAGGAAQYALWGVAIVLDVVAAAIAGRAETWNLHAEHFAERHGLFVIIALGETLIVAAVGVTGAAWTRDLIMVGVLGVAVVCGLWWSYFGDAKPALDRAFESCPAGARAGMARDAFSLAHFPLICGVIAFAVALESVVAHPSEPLSLATRAAFGISMLLYGGGMVLAMWRATGRVLWLRLAVQALLCAFIVGVPQGPLPAFGAALLASIVIGVGERVQVRRAAAMSSP
jgi:low temperature requirement protein LtrA